LKFERPVNRIAINNSLIFISVNLVNLINLMNEGSENSFL
jgi:hypothetical protein